MSRPGGEGYTIGVDVGTTAVKAVAVDAKGEVVARARVPHVVGAPSADYLEHDVAKAWRRGPRKAFAHVSSQLDAPAAGLAVSSMVPSITAVGPRGKVLLPGLLYGDARARAVGLAPGGSPEDLGGERDQGKRMLAWAIRERPDARGYWNCQAVATHALTGVPGIDTATTTSFGGLYGRRGWDAAGLKALGVTESQLPVVGQMGGALGSIPGAPTVFAGGTIDAFCEQIVAGASHPGDVLVIFGATLIVWVVTEEWRDVPGLTTLPNMIAGQVMIGGPSNAGALFIDWVRSVVGAQVKRGRDHDDGGVGEIARVGDPGRVPVWLPYLRGERTPFHDCDLKASLHDLDISQGPDALVRGAHEASGFVIRRIIERSGFGARRIVAAGGGSRSVAWMQAVADATGLPVDTAAVPEGAALGAAFLARMAAGLESSFDAAGDWARTGRRIDPDPLWAAAAADRFSRFDSLGSGA